MRRNKTLGKNIPVSEKSEKRINSLRNTVLNQISNAGDRKEDEDGEIKVVKVLYLLENGKVKETVQVFHVYENGIERNRKRRREIFMTILEKTNVIEKVRKIEVQIRGNCVVGKRNIFPKAISKKRILKRKLEKPKNSSINIKDEILLLIGAVVSN